MALRTVNLNLLPALQALLAEASVTRAAESLGISQSAMSDALSRLRATFDDPLLVRAGRRMALSPRAVELTDEINRLGRDLQSLFTRRTFDPATSTRRFVVATPDFGALLIARRWLDRLAAQAPNVTLRFVGIDGALPLKLARCDLDFVILPEPMLDQIPDAPLEGLPLSRLPLGADRLVALFRAGHPLDCDEAVSRERLARHRLLAFHPDLDAVERRYGKLLARGTSLEPVLSLPGLTALPFILQQSDDVGLVPERFADAITSMLPLRSAPLPFAPDRLPVVLAWSKAQEHDAAHRWFRHHIVRDAAPTPADQA